MTKTEAIAELTRAAEICPTTPLAEACRMAVDALSGVAPTVDAVPVVRCKDCVRFDKKRGCNLVEGLNIAKTDSFCSYGERKDGDHHG